MNSKSRVACAGVVILVLCHRGVQAAPMLVSSSVGTLELVTPLAGQQALLDKIDGLAFDAYGNLFGALEISGSGGGVVYIDKATGNVTTLVTGISRADQIALAANGDFWVTSEVSGASTTSRIYRVTPTYNASNIPTSAVAVSLTTGTAIDNPEGLVVLDSGSAYGNAGDLYVAEDANPGNIFHVQPGTGTTTPLASGLNRPEGLAFGDFAGALSAALYGAETSTNRIIQILSDGSVSTFGVPSAVSLTSPDNVEFGPDGYLYVTEDRSDPNSRVIRIDSAGNHSVLATGFGQASGITFDPSNGDLYISEQDFDRVWRVEFVPEPSTLCLLLIGLGCAALAAQCRRRLAD